MTLKGWSNPLAQWIVNAIAEGKLTVYYDKKTNCELLKGMATNPFGIIIEFQ